MYVEMIVSAQNCVFLDLAVSEIFGDQRKHPPTHRNSHRIIELERAYKAIESNFLLKAGIQIKVYLTDAVCSAIFTRRFNYCALFVHIYTGSG